MQTDFKSDLIRRYWEYQKSQFPDWQLYFDRPDANDGRPPVFLPHESWHNVLINPHPEQIEIQKLLSFVPPGEKHKWYRSMNSSQALAQSLFGNLAVHECAQVLSDLKADEGYDLFGKAQLSPGHFAMEHKINHLGEPRPTSLDGYISGEYQIAIECKFTESEVGSCSRPGLTPADANYASDHCDGNYAIQRSRKVRCPLTQNGVLYWHFVPLLFRWNRDSDFTPCPLYKNYQLVRNVLAAGVSTDGTVSYQKGHAILIYDERNPAFQLGGKGLAAYLETKQALRVTTMLRKCSWQRIIKHLRELEILPWLTQSLFLKYGL